MLEVKQGVCVRTALAPAKPAGGQRPRGEALTNGVCHETGRMADLKLKCTLTGLRKCKTPVERVAEGTGRWRDWAERPQAEEQKPTECSGLELS